MLFILSKIASSILQSYRIKSLHGTFIFTDASKNHWEGDVTQTKPEDLKKTFDEQVHEPIAYVGGELNRTQLSWKKF